MNYFVETPYIASFDNLAKPFSRSTFRLSIPSLLTKYPIKLYLVDSEIVALTSRCRNEDYRTDLMAFALFLV
jgi:ssRNA-specific RNase YbeY (16S rRNA maturation enzyme)